jgi:hypothetical protein
MYTKMTKYAQLRNKYGRGSFEKPVSSVALLSIVVPVKPKVSPTAEQIAAALRRAFVIEFQNAYKSKANTQDR